MDIGIASTAIHSIIDCFAGTALTSSSSNMSRADKILSTTETADDGSRRVLLHRGKSSTCKTDICVSTGAIGVVNLGSACTRKYTHSVFGGLGG